MTTDLEFEAWWESEGEYLRAGGGDYEKTFAYHAWVKARQQNASKYKCLDCNDTGVNASNGYDCQYCFGDLQGRSLADAQAEIARLRGALEGLTAAYEEAGPDMDRAARHRGRVALIAAREALNT